jgi:hypothetical protein
MQDDKKLPASEDDPHVQEFLDLWGLKDPVFVDYVDTGAGYGADFCHVSAKHAAQEHGGRRVHGWALWQYDDPTGVHLPIIIGDFHSVWETPGGELKDVTPPKLGLKVLFVRDPSLAVKATDTSQLLYHNRTNVAGAPRLLNGAFIAHDCFAMPNDNPYLVAYCRKLGLKDTSMV